MLLWKRNLRRIALVVVSASIAVGFIIIIATIVKGKRQIPRDGVGVVGNNLFGGLSQPGENGRGVIVPPEYLEESRKLFQRNKFNQWVSDRISLHRSLPDARISE